MMNQSSDYGTPFSIIHCLKLLSITGLFFLSSISLQAQKDTVVIIFNPTATPADIGSFKAALNAKQIGFTTPSEARLWEVECRPGKPCYYDGDNYIDVNEVIKKVSSATKTESIGKNYPTQIPPYFNSPAQDPNGPFTIQELTACNAVPIVTKKGTLSEEIVIALIDSGVDKDHGFFKYASYFTSTSRTFIGANCFNDQKGHGTHIAGIIRIMDILGGSSNSFKIMNLQTQEPDGSGTIWNAIRAVDWANKKGAHIINMSLGYIHDPLIDSIEGKQPLEVAIDKANIISDILVVASAGNDAMDIDTVRHYPSAFACPNLLSVASDSCSTYFSSWFSNFGMINVDLAAPGEDILGPNLYGSIPQWTRKTGTSMAAGIVTGATGLLATHQSSISDGRLKCAVMASADFKGYPVYTEGTLHTPDAKDSLLYGRCAGAPMLVTPPTKAVSGSLAMGQDPQTGIAIFPLPFSETIAIRFSAAEEGPAQWFIFDAFGRVVASGDAEVNAGTNQLTWEGSHLPAGLYWFNIDVGEQHLVRKMIKQ